MGGRTRWPAGRSKDVSNGRCHHPMPSMSGGKGICTALPTTVPPGANDCLMDKLWPDTSACDSPLSCKGLLPNFDSESEQAHPSSASEHEGCEDAMAPPGRVAR